MEDVIKKEELLSAPRSLEDIVRRCQEKETSIEEVEGATSSIASLIQSASHFKQRKLAETTSSTCSLVTKILLLREFRAPFTETFFSVDVVLSSENGGSESRVYEKIKLRNPVGYGGNLNGRLGVGKEDAEIQSFAPIALDLMIEGIYMSANHTIFLLKDGSFYGVGQAENFMTDGTTGILTVPVKLDYVELPRDQLHRKPHCIVTDDSTTFIHYQERTNLIVRSRKHRDVAQAGGQNWELQECRRIGRCNCKDEELVAVTITSVLSNRPEVYVIMENCWSSRSSFGKIILIICGKRVDIESDFLRASILKDGLATDKLINIILLGTIYVTRSGTLYKGKLTTCLRKVEDDEAKEESIVAFLKEVVLPFAVDGFYVNSSGDSFVFFPTPIHRSTRRTADMRTVQSIDSPLELPRFHIRGCIYLREPQVSGSHLRARFEDYLRRLPEDFAIQVYGVDKSSSFATGLPQKCLETVSTLLVLRHFLRIDTSSQVPVVLLELDSVDSDEFEEELKKKFYDSLDAGTKLKPLVATGSSESRSEEIATKAKNFFDAIHTDIANSLDVLISLPLRYRRRNRDTHYGLTIDSMLYHANDAAWKVRFEARNRSFDKIQMKFQPDVKTIVEERNPQDPMLMTLKVEAVPVEYEGSDYDCVIRSYYLESTTTVYFVKLIDERLLEHVEDGVLNLNVACIDDVDKFPDLLLAFFDYPETYGDLSAHRKHPNLDYQKIQEKSPSSLDVQARDGTVAFPQPLVDIFTRSDSFDEIGTRFSTEAFQRLTEVLVDPPTFFHLKMEMKKEVFQLTQALGIKHIELYLILQIVLTATEDDEEFITSLFNNFEDAMIEYVGQYRSDILLHWNHLPFDMNNLDILTRCAEKMEVCFSKECILNVHHFPVTLQRDKQFDTELIEKEWLYKQLSKGGEDEDVHWTLSRLIMKWSGYVCKPMKHNRDCPHRKRVHDTDPTSPDDNTFSYQPSCRLVRLGDPL